MKRFFVLFTVCFLSLSTVLAQSSVGGADGPMYTDEGFAIISPVAGRWANKQPLVLEVPESFEVFYSLSGSDPMESGFAYDGPVMLEAEGEVRLKIALVLPDGNVVAHTVSYAVAPPESDGIALDVNFGRPVVGYSAGQRLRIPAGFSYRLGNSPAFLPGEQVLSLEGGAFPRRHLPCEITDGVDSWRFVISPDGIPAVGSPAGSSVGKKDGVESLPVGENEESLPFQISEWGLLTFTQDKLIYTIDDAHWQEATGTVVLDRNVGHTIYWQSVAYEEGNPVYSLYLPPKPSASLKFHVKEAVTIDFGPDFTLRPSLSDWTPQQALCIDAFYGEELEANFSLDIYYKGQLQGRSDVSLRIDKCPPPTPVVESSSELFYNREDVTVGLRQAGEGELFYSVETLVAEAAGFQDLALEFSGKEIVVQEDFLPYRSGPLSLESSDNHARLFLVRAFAQDRLGNRSPIATYRAIVDPVNYYVVPQGEEPPQPGFRRDGSLARPFVSLQQALRETEGKDFVRLHIGGMLSLGEQVVIPSNCEIYGSGGAAGFNFLPGGGLRVQGGQVSIRNCILELQAAASAGERGSPMLSLLSGSLSLDNCEILGDYADDGTLISATDGSLVILDSGITLRSGRYGALVSALRSTVSVSGGRLAVVAPTAVIFSLSAGGLTLSDSECKVFAQLGRVAELTGVGFSLTNNSFHGVFEDITVSTAQLVPVWSDNRSKLIESRGNSIFGFPGS